MSAGGWKEPFYGKAKRDSRFIEDFANKIGWQGLEDEAKYNQENPGHAIGKAAQYAATWYLLNGMDAGAAPAAEAALGAGTGAGAETAVDIAAQQAAQQALAQGAGTTVANTTVQPGLLDKLVSGSGTGKGGLLAQQMGMRMLAPQGQQPMPQPGPRTQGSMEPLRNPYASQQGGPYGTAAGNSMGMLTEEQKRKLRAQGIQV